MSFQSSEPEEDTPPQTGLSRRGLLRAALAGSAGTLLGGSRSALALPPAITPPNSSLILPPHGTARYFPGIPGMGLPGTPLQADNGPQPPRAYWPAPNKNQGALRGTPNFTDPLTQALEAQGIPIRTNAATGNLANITNTLYGSGLYIGNEFKTMSDTTRQWVFEQIRSWGFKFVCPKVGGYGSTYYSGTTQLQNWIKWSQQVGLGFVPFIYTTPTTNYIQDANVTSQIANNCGIAVVDMESEWNWSTTAEQTSFRAAMTSFGTQYRKGSPTAPVIVTGFGDPYYAFGSAWPYAEMAAWADGYSPQWYYGVWDQYLNFGAVSAVNWGDSYCSQAYGSSYPLIPSLSVYCSFTSKSSDGYLPRSDIAIGANYTSLWKAPIIWWEYQGMNASRAAACLA